MCQAEATERALEDARKRAADTTKEKTSMVSDR
jgi:hypothetical protein